MAIVMIDGCEEICGLGFVQERLDSRNELGHANLLVSVLVHDCGELSHGLLFPHDVLLQLSLDSQQLLSLSGCTLGHGIRDLVRLAVLLDQALLVEQEVADGVLVEEAEDLIFANLALLRHQSVEHILSLMQRGT